MTVEIFPDQMQDLEGMRKAIRELLNLVESLSEANQELRKTVQALKDELAGLKGEQGKPKIRANKPDETDHSSEKERKDGSKGNNDNGEPKLPPLSKNQRIKITRDEKIEVDPAILPADAEFKGYEECIVQDIIIKNDNIRFLKAKHYSASQKQTYLGRVPLGYEGQFGPRVKSLVIAYYYAAGMSQGKIVEVFLQMGVIISEGQVSNILTHPAASWHAEAREVTKAGLASTSWQHMDDTTTRVDGVSQYCHVLANPYYSAYITRPNKTRLTIISILQGSETPIYLLNENTQGWLIKLGVPIWAQQKIATWTQNTALTDEILRKLIETELAPQLCEAQQTRVLEAAALTAYYDLKDWPIIPILVSDDAPQFKKITQAHGLCWIHDGRAYKKLLPVVAHHRALLEDFLKRYWVFYHQLNAYIGDDSPNEAGRESQSEKLRAEFVALFSEVSGYAALDKCIANTLSKQTELLLVLTHPEVPLHNNPAELAVRQRVRKRDVSFGPRGPAGRAAWDTFATLAETTKKLGISFYEFVYDRICRTQIIPLLSEVLRSHAAPVSA